MSFAKILCPTDFSSGSERAVRMAARLAAQRNAELVIAHCWYIPSFVHPIDMPLPANLTQEIVDDARRGLEAAVAAAYAAGATRVSSTLVSGVPWTQIVHLLEQQAFDLCVIGTHGRTGLARILLGSVAEKVIRHSPCSTLAIRPSGEVAAFSHLLIPTDFSESAGHALELAPKLVEPDGAITLLHVIELPVRYAGELPSPDLARELDRHAADALDRAAQKLRSETSARVSIRSRIGYPGAQTLHVIEDDPTIDLVVMGSHGRTGVKRALLGSVAEKIVRHARCPVLVARR